MAQLTGRAAGCSSLSSSSSSSSGSPPRGNVRSGSQHSKHLTSKPGSTSQADAPSDSMLRRSPGACRSACLCGGELVQIPASSCQLVPAPSCSDARTNLANRQTLQYSTPKAHQEACTFFKTQNMADSRSAQTLLSPWRYSGSYSPTERACLLARALARTLGALARTFRSIARPRSLNSLAGPSEQGARALRLLAAQPPASRSLAQSKEKSIFEDSAVRRGRPGWGRGGGRPAGPRAFALEARPHILAPVSGSRWRAAGQRGVGE